MNNLNKKSQDVLTALISISVPLIQIVAVITVALSDQLKLTKYFIRSDALPLINVLVIILILSLIGIISNYENAFFTYKKIHRNFFILIIDFIKDKLLRGLNIEKDVSQPSFEPSKSMIIVSTAPKIFIFFQIPSFLILVISIFISKTYFDPIILTITQYFSYTVFLVSSGIVIFIWVKEFLKRQSNVKPEDYYPNITTALRAHGLLPDPKIEFLNRCNIATSYGDKLQKVSIDNIIYYVKTDFSGRIIISSWKATDAPSYIKDYIENIEREVFKLGSTASVSPSV